MLNNLGMFDQFQNNLIQFDVVMQDGCKGKLTFDVMKFFKIKFLHFAKLGIIIEKITCEEINQMKKFVLYTSTPEFGAEEIINPSVDFKKWVTRFFHVVDDDVTFNEIKNNNKLKIEVKNRIRKNERWSVIKGDIMYYSYLLSWNLMSLIDNDKIKAASDFISNNLDNELNLNSEEDFKALDQYEKNLDNVQDILEAMEKLPANIWDKYKELITENPDETKELSDLLGLF